MERRVWSLFAAQQARSGCVYIMVWMPKAAQISVFKGTRVLSSAPLATTANYTTHTHTTKRLPTTYVRCLSPNQASSSIGVNGSVSNGTLFMYLVHSSRTALDME